MFKAFKVLLFILCLSFTGKAQKFEVVVNYVLDHPRDDDRILYKPGRVLSWDDFKGTPPADNPAAALTNAGFGLQLNFKRIGTTSQLQVNINCSFSRKNSWVKPGNKTAYILNHEQKHFDLSFLHTLLFIKKVREAPLTSANYAAVIEKIYNETALVMSKAQQDYDRETSHSRLKDNQAAWDLRITEQLATASLLE